MKHFFQDKAGYLNTKPVKVKVSGDGAKMTKLTGFVLLSFAVLEKDDEILSIKDPFNQWDII